MPVPTRNRLKSGPYSLCYAQMERFLRCRNRLADGVTLSFGLMLLHPTLGEADEGTPFSLRIGGFVQADAVAYRQDSEDQLDGSTGQPLNETRFVIRRARLRAEADARYVGGILELDGNTVIGTQARLLEPRPGHSGLQPADRLPT